MPETSTNATMRRAEQLKAFESFVERECKDGINMLIIDRWMNEKPFVFFPASKNLYVSSTLWAEIKAFFQWPVKLGLHALLRDVAIRGDGIDD